MAKDCLVHYVRQLLDADSAGAAKPWLDKLIEQLCSVTGVELHPPLFTDKGATITAHGKAVSPTTAAQCAEDIERTRVFMRGGHHALRDKMEQGETVRLLYAGTGPFGLLVVPLLPLFDPTRLRVTLLDIHKESLGKLGRLLDTLDVWPFIDAIVQADATVWSPAPGVHFDLIVSETMKHLLQQEPQVRIFAHLQQFLAPDGKLIPENITLGASLTNTSHPLAEKPENIPLGDFFVLNRASAARLHAGDNGVLTKALALPEHPTESNLVKLTTSIQVYREHRLAENQSQLTLPRYKRDLKLVAGSSLLCRYDQGDYPDWQFHVQQAKDEKAGAGKLLSFPAANQMNGATVVSFAPLPRVGRLRDLEREVQQLIGETWVDHVNQRDYEGGWDVLPLRCQRQHETAHAVMQAFAIAAGDEWQDLPVLQFCPAIQDVLRQLHCPVKSVRLMRLKPGAAIKPHRDRGLSLEHGEARLHMPIHTSDQVLFTVNGLTVPMRAGELWYINADQEHAVHHRGAEDRINLVVDCVANDWLRNQVQATAQQAAWLATTER